MTICKRPLPFLETCGISPEEYKAMTLDQIRQYMSILYSEKNNNDNMNLSDERSSRFANPNK